MFGIGMPELAVIIVVALVVLGPKRLPEVARSLGKGLAEFRRLTGDVNKELDAARHMIESEARDHENERRRADREARAASQASVAEAGTAAEPVDRQGNSPEASNHVPEKPAETKAQSSDLDPQQGSAPSASDKEPAA